MVEKYTLRVTISVRQHTYISEIELTGNIAEDISTSLQPGLWRTHPTNYSFSRAATVMRLC
jgi:hypothetical protein